MVALLSLPAYAGESALVLPGVGVSEFTVPAACPERPRGIRIGVVPILNFTSDRGLTLGAMSRRFDYRTHCAVPFRNVLTLEASFATRGARIFEVAQEQTGISRWKLRSMSVLNYTDNRYQSYYGLGPDTIFDPELEKRDYYRFTHRELLFENSIRRKIPGTFAEPQLGVAVARTSFAPGREASRYEQDFGSEERNFFTTRFFIRNVWEARDSEFTPSKGQYGMVGVTYSPEGLGSFGESWARWEGDYRIYTPFVSDRRLWLANQLRYTGSTDGTPISEKARLGSVGTLRGLPYSRYIGNHSASFRTDLRSLWLRTRVFELPFKLGSGVFYDVGRIADEFDGLADESFHHSYGFSVFGSYFTDDFLGSADFGFSEGQTVFYVRLGHPF